jgi:hypothetical protein
MAQLAERLEQLVSMGQPFASPMAQLAERLEQLAKLAKFLMAAAPRGGRS